MKKRHKRVFFVVVGLFALGTATGFVLLAFRSNLVFFYSPSDIAAKQAPVDRALRIGGLVENGSLQRDTDGLTVRFKVTDTAQTIPVIYKGILPDLFKEGRGCVAQGRLGADGVFYADQVLAKHDENYMPPEAGQAIDKAKAAKTLTEN